MGDRITVNGGMAAGAASAAAKAGSDAPGAYRCGETTPRRDITGVAGGGGDGNNKHRAASA